MTVTVYGISNCDTVKKALTWLDVHAVIYAFHDYKRNGVEASLLEQWVDAVGWEMLLNRAGTSFRKLPDADKVAIDRTKALTLMLANPSMIKRPVVTGASQLLVGFKSDIWDATFG
jgi:arsenate reductase (glutaredoxin)